MSEQTGGSAAASVSLPDAANLEWLRKQAKRRLHELRQTNPSAKLSDAQFDLAKRYGFSSWRALKAHIDSLTVDGQLFDAARKGDVHRLGALLDRYPEKLRARAKPYEWTLLHLAAQHLAAVDLLLRRGLDVNAREKGDNTYAMHWAAAAGRLDVVRRLADAGGDVVGQGDDHELEVIGWATCWDGCDDAAHRAVASFLVSRGARHHIFSAVAMNLADEVRRIVAEDPSSLNKRMSRNEDHQLPLHFAVRMNRPEMVSLLLEQGADPLGVDGSGYPAAAYAKVRGVDRPVMEAIRAMTSAELTSAMRGHRRPHVRMMDLLAALALSDWETAARLWSENASGNKTGGATAGVMHLMAKRGDVRAIQWLLERGADPNARWSHWDAEVTPLHLAALGGHAEAARLLLAGGADPSIRDSKHDSDPVGWAEFFRHPEVVQLLKAGGRGTGA
jgi:ankyrin repeat protein